MPSSLKVKSITDGIADSLVSAGDTLEFYAASTLLGTLDNSSPNFTAGSSIASEAALSIQVVTSNDYILSIEYSDDDSVGNSLGYIYIPSGSTTYYLDKYGNTYSDAALITAVSDVGTFEESVGIESVDVTRTDQQSVAETVEANSTFGEGDTTFEITETISSLQALDNNRVVFAQEIPIHELFDQAKTQFISVTQRLSILESFDLQKTISVEDRVYLAQSLLNAFEQVTEFINYVKVNSSFVGQIPKKTFLETVEASQELSRVALMTFNQVIPIIEGFLPDELNSVGLTPVNKPEFKTDQFDCGNSSLKLLSGVKLYGFIPVNTKVAIHFLINGTWYYTEFISLNPQKIAYFNVQGEAFKIHVQSEVDLRLSINVFEVMWKQMDKNNIRSAYYYGTQTNQ